MIRYALRSLRRNPSFTIVAVLALALALALNTTLFALADALVHPYMPYAEPARVFSVFLNGGDKRRPIAPDALYRAISQGLGSAQEIASAASIATMVAGDKTVEDQFAVAASPNLFDVLGVRAMLGRTFNADDANSSAPGAVISFALWNRFFHGRPLGPDVKVTVGSQTFPVIGVMPRGVHYLFMSDVWVPRAALTGDQRPKGMMPVFRLKPGATRERAQQEIDAVLAHLGQEYGQVTPYYARLLVLNVRAGTLTAFKGMLGVVSLVLLIAGANLGTMMLARGMARRREIAIRVALGASRRAIAGEVLAECAVVTTAGVALAFLFMTWALHVIPHFVAPFVRGLGDVQATPNWRVFAFTAAIAVATVLLAGALPALRAASTDPAEPMKEGGMTTGKMRDRYNPLIIVEVALSTGLLTTAALFALYAAHLSLFQFRYDANRLVVGNMMAPARDVPSRQVAQFYSGLLEQVRAVPGAVQAATRWQMGTDHGVILAEEGPSGNHWMNASQVSVVSPSYLATLGIPVVQGRDFAPGDAAADGDVVVVDEHAARQLWPDGVSPVGHMVKLGVAESKRPWLRVVGVARWTELQPRHDPDLPPEPIVYVVKGRDSTADREVIVRGSGIGGTAGRASLIIAVRRELQAAAPWVGLPGVHSWLADFENWLSSTEFMSSIFTAFGSFGLVLCAVGLFGVLAYTVSRRRREFALRIALGARTPDVIRLVVHDTTVTVLAGIGAGGFLALAATNGLRMNLAVGYDWAIALAVSEAILVLVGIVACLAPLRQATKADPVEVLRAT